jgi:hypothetical protein
MREDAATKEPYRFCYFISIDLLASSPHPAALPGFCSYVTTMKKNDPLGM